MAKLTASFWGPTVDMSIGDFSDFADGRGRIVNDHTLRMSLHGDVTTIKGDFTFNKKGELTGGVATYVDFGFGPYEETVWSNVKIGLRAWDKIARSETLDDDTALLARIFEKDDQISSDDGDDLLFGFAGDDIFVTGWGNDDITGGLGADIFKYVEELDSGVSFGIDEIVDFSQSEGDRISFREVGNFIFIGAAEFSGSGDEVRYHFSGGKTIIETDPLANAYAMEIRLKSEIALTEADFIL